MQNYCTWKLDTKGCVQHAPSAAHQEEQFLLKLLPLSPKGNLHRAQRTAAGQCDFGIRHTRTHVYINRRCPLWGLNRLGAGILLVPQTFFFEEGIPVARGARLKVRLVGPCAAAWPIGKSSVPLLAASERHADAQTLFMTRVVALKRVLPDCLGYMCMLPNIAYVY